MWKRAFWVFVVLGLPTALIVVGYLIADNEVTSHTTKAGKLILRDADTAAREVWILLAVGLVVLVLLAGWLSKGEVFGAFIDARNRYSLSRVQVAAWTALVLSAWLAVVLVRVAGGVSIDDALKVDIPGAVLAALGVSVGSFAFSAGINDSKRKQTVKPTWQVDLQNRRNLVYTDLQAATTTWADAKANAAIATGDDQAALEKQALVSKTKVDALTAELADLDNQIKQQQDAEGLLVKNSSPSEASAADLFRGEEIADAQTIDFGKVQMLYISIAAIGAYGFVLAEGITKGTLFASGGVSLPELTDSIVVLLGISHAGYLTVKASNSEPTRTSGT